MSGRRALAAAAAAPWALWALVRLPGLDVRHPLQAVMALTPYAALTALVPVVLALLLRQRAVALVAAAVAAALIAVVLPRGLAGPGPQRPGAPRRPLTVMTLNLRFGRADARAVVRLVRRHRVDVLALEELTPGAVARLDAAGVRRLLPGRVLEPRPGAVGSGLMSRWPVRLTRRGASWDPAEPEGALRPPGAAALRVQVVHPDAPVTGDDARDWRRLLRALPGPSAGDALRLIAGDFNGTLDNRALRGVLDRGYVDAADAAGAGWRPTFPSGRRALGIVIDHVLVPHSVRVRRVTVEAVPGSDHRTVVAEVAIPRGR